MDILFRHSSYLITFQMFCTADSALFSGFLCKIIVVIGRVNGGIFKFGFLLLNFSNLISVKLHLAEVHLLHLLPLSRKLGSLCI